MTAPLDETMPDERGDLPAEAPGRLPQSGTALCLSGGGYRAMLFHVGALWRLNEAGRLKSLSRISSVSGGSITAACLGMNWDRLDFDADGVAANFDAALVAPVRKVAGITIDIPAILGGLFPFGPISDRVAKAYRKHLFGASTLQDLPDDPRFVINASNLQSGALWRFMKPYMRDWRVGEVPNPTTQLAIAVAASSAFPPLLSPLILHLNPGDFRPKTGAGLQRVPYTSRVVLTDGGVYDNLGLETVWKGYGTVLVSDGGGKMQPEERPWIFWPMQLLRVLNVIDNQVRSLRKRSLISSFKDRDRMIKAGLKSTDDIVRQLSREGTYWGIRTDIADYKLSDPLDCPYEKTLALAQIATRLKKLPGLTQERLINWGYAVTDAALRKHVDRNLPKPAGFPYPGGVG